MAGRREDGPGQAPGHVVVCDAEAESAQSLAAALGAAGFRVTVCATAAACEEAVAAESPALVTLPVLLPDLDGFALIGRLCAHRDAVSGAARSLRAQPARAARHAFPRVAMVSALQAEHRARAAGADAFVRKPVQAPEIVGVAGRILRGAGRRAGGRPRGSPAGGGAAAPPGVIARTARAVAAVGQPEEALAAVLGAARAHLGASGAALLRSEAGRLVPAGGSGLDRAARTLDEAGLLPAGGGGYPIVLAGWLEGVLLLADVQPSALAAQEAALAPLLDLAAAALRNSRLLADWQRRRREREASSFARLAGPAPAEATAQSFGIAPLRAAAPGVFEGLAARYGELLDLALEQRGYKVDHHLPQALRAFAERLGSAGATPRDVIEVHTATLRGKTAHAAPRKGLAYLEEGQLMVLELMGHLASFYRSRARPLAARASDMDGVGHAADGHAADGLAVGGPKPATRAAREAVR